MTRQSELVAEFETLRERQHWAGQFFRDYRDAGLPLLAESYERECKELGDRMLAAIEELRSLDPKYSKKSEQTS